MSATNTRAIYDKITETTTSTLKVKSEPSTTSRGADPSNIEVTIIKAATLSFLTPLTLNLSRRKLGIGVHILSQRVNTNLKTGKLIITVILTIYAEYKRTLNRIMRSRSGKTGK
jgi:hypothetical protein